MTPADNPAGPAPALEALFPSGTVAAELRREADAALLLPEERAVVVKAAAKRVRDFAGGRLCARHVLEALGVQGFALLPAEDRRPLWPAGIVGSITHSQGYAAAVAAPVGRFCALGLDAEVIDRVTPNLYAAICTAPEIAWLEGLDAHDRRLGAALVFSAKEAFYKCQYTISSQFLEFHDVSLDLDRTELSRGVYRIRLIRKVPALEQAGYVLEGRFAAQGEHLVSAMAFPNRPDRA